MANLDNKKEKISKALFEILKNKKLKVKQSDILNKIEIPPSSEMGDFAFPCFFLSSVMKESPADIALELRSEIKKMKYFSGVQTKGPYINFFFNREEDSSEIISEILNEKENFGKFKSIKTKTNKSVKEKQKVVMIEFSQANTHKAFHIGHLRNTMIGESLSRIFEFNGNKVIRANYQGDIGMHVAKWLWCYKKYHSKETPKEDESWIASIYVDAVKRLEKNKDLQTEVDEINRKIDSRTDEPLNKLWKETREMSLRALEKIYKQLNTHFDTYFFESEMEKRGKEIVSLMLNDKIAEKSDGAIIMDLKKYNLGVWVLIRKDGTILYSAKDLALAEKKFSNFHPELSIYVIADEQDLHFKQLIKTLELTKFPDVKKMVHVSYATVRLPEGKMSSRTGNNILYSDFVEKVKDYASKEIKKREKKISNKELESRALKVSMAAMKYDLLKQGETKQIIFNIKESLNFEGNSGPYILYSYARANSILKKSLKKENPQTKLALEEKELELVKKLSQFPETVSKSYRLMSPSVIANYAYQLAQKFNEFYHSCPVIKSKKESFRISLVRSFMYVLKNSLNLLGIETLDEM